MKGLLLGAGFSFDFGMPLASELTEIFLGLFDRHVVARLVPAMAKHNPFSADRPPNAKAIGDAFDILLKYKESRDKGGNYELALTEIQKNGSSFERTQSDRDSFEYVFGFLYGIIHDILSVYQGHGYRHLYDKNKVWYAKLGDLLSDKETWVFSLNHDYFFECLAIDLGMEVSYGGTSTLEFPVSNMEMDSPISFSCIERTTYGEASPGFITVRQGINLVKLHGSLCELEYRDNTVICNPSLKAKTAAVLMNDLQNIGRMRFYHRPGEAMHPNRDWFITGLDGTPDVVRLSMLTGGQKYSRTTERRYGEEKLAILEDVLAKLSHLTVIGYGFADKHVNNRLSNAMVRRGDLMIQIVDPVRNGAPECLEQFDYKGRVRTALCGASHWISYCKVQKWDENQMKAYEDNKAARQQVRRIVEEEVKGRIRF
jgi:hypothetical protein